jgi:hypothetical protein
MDPITLDRNLADKLNMGMDDGTAIELPFPVIYLWPVNGQASYKSQVQTAPALYYGGWAAKAEDVQMIADQAGSKPPAGWIGAAIDTRDGGEFEAFVTRSVIVAPIGKRESWLLDGARQPHYTEGARRHVQCLCYLAEKQGTNGDAKFIPWGPVVLTAKGYQAKNLLAAFAAWEKSTSNLRYKVAPGVPAWCFYFAVGTFGKDRQAVNVGKPGSQSPITPVTAYIPDKMDEVKMHSLFVGEEVVAMMADYMDQAADWLKAWKEPVQEPARGEGGDDFFLPAGEEEVPF